MAVIAVPAARTFFHHTHQYEIDRESADAERLIDGDNIIF